MTDKKGIILEWFVEGILRNCGFRKVEEDKIMTYKRGEDFFVQGLGQSHQIDVLMYPPFQIPFYYPSRIAVECKCYKNNIDLPIARSLLGLREDLNNFEIITKEKLKDRQNYRRKKTLVDTTNKFQYSVVLATTSNITKPAEEYLITYRIPYIILNSSSEQFLLNFIEENNLISVNIENFKKRKYDSEDFLNKDKDFIIKANDYFNKSYIGVTENGTLIFLTGNLNFASNNELEYKTEIHWRDQNSKWEISFNNNKLYFDLPIKEFENWKETKFDKIKAIDLKEKEFKRIFLFKKIDNEQKFIILNLNLDFISKIKRDLEN